MRALLLVLLGACDVVWQQPAPASDRCDEAQVLLLECGASFALFDRSMCAGPAFLAAECVVEHGGACEDLANLSEGCARVIADALDGVEPPEAPGDECRPPAALAFGVLFSVDSRNYRVDGLTYCRCVESFPLAANELCAPPGALANGGICTSPCVPCDCTDCACAGESR